MAAPIIYISVEENLRDSINIKVDIIHPEPITAVAFPAAAVAENDSLRAKIKTTEAIEKITHSQDRRDRMKMERQLALIQESQRQDRENFKKLQ
nr:hypothetical protein [Tanacetum cinerariifolium]